MRLFARLAAASVLLSSAPAFAGGIGLLGGGGLYQTRAYYYREDGLQGIDTQLRPTGGGGFEVFLGDRDDKIWGITRFYGLIDAPPNEPDLSGEDTANYEFFYPPAHEQPAARVGIGSAGIQWIFLGDPTKFHMGATTLLGAGFITVDNLEYFLAEPGLMVGYTAKERFNVFANVSASIRFRKVATYGGNAVVGVRYLFD